MIKNVINLSGHPLSSTAISQLEDRGYEVETIPVGVDLNKSIADQVKIMVDQIKSIPMDGSVPFIITIPGLSEITAFLLAELHGRTGGFPKICQLRRGEEGTFQIGEFSHAENVEEGIADLEKVRLKARGRRWKK